MRQQFALILMLNLIGNVCMSQNWQWANAIRSNQTQVYERGSVCSDGVNIYLNGNYDNILTFPDSLFSFGFNEIFMAKYDAMGNKIWKKNFGSAATGMTCTEQIYVVYSPIENCIYATGIICGTTTLGSSQLFTHGLGDVFLAKLDTSGQFIWAKSFGGIDNEQTRIYIDSLGSIYLGCKISSSCLIDTFNVSPGGVVAKFDTSGKCNWVLNCMNGPEDNEIIIDFIEYDLLIGGGYYVNSTIGIGTTVNLTNNNSTLDAYLVRMDTLGNVKWVHCANTSGMDVVSDIKVDNNLNIYCAMSYTDSILIDSIEIHAQGKSSSVLKLSQNGALLDYNQFHCNGDLIGITDMILNADGSLSLNGVFSQDGDFDGYLINTTNQRNMFLAGLDSNLDCFGVKSVTDAIGLSICEDLNHDLYCSGLYLSNTNFGSINLSTLKSPDIYLSKISSITGIGEFERNANKDGLVIYENPNTGTFNIKIPEKFKKESRLELSIHDFNSKLIESSSIDITLNTVKVNVAKSLSEGIYLVSLSNGTEIVSGKVIIK